MRLGTLLTVHGLVSPADVERAVDRQAKHGGRLGDNLIALGLITADQLNELLYRAPAAPATLADTGVPSGNLLRLVLKCMAADGVERPSELCNRTKLPYPLILSLLDEARERKLIEALAAGGLKTSHEFRFTLTMLGRERAAEALDQCLYVGPAPVSLASYCHQVVRQRISNERIDRDMIMKQFCDIVVPDTLVRKIGPAINSMLSLLLYGAAGNGKTTIAEKIARIFSDVIYVPYAVEVDGQIIKIFDPAIHSRPDHAPQDEDGPVGAGDVVRRGEFDQRWVPCKRPVIITGGELTLEMLDLQFNSLAKFYEAPLHMKALNGTFIADDFGRQLVKPEELLNRWIIPLESRRDYLKLHTGQSFSVPFDEFVIFSTNLTPEDLTDPAFLRRIPYKMEIGGPSIEGFKDIFRAVARKRGMETTPEILDYVVDQLLNKEGKDLACYQPKFIIDQVVAACKFDGRPPTFSFTAVADALDNLYMHLEADAVDRTPQAAF